MRVYTVSTSTGDIAVEKGTILLDALHRAGISVSANCGGKGLCGKCKVRIVEDAEEKSVLSCRYRIERDLTVLRTDNDRNRRQTGNLMDVSAYPGHYAAVDLGTTGVSVLLHSGTEGYEKNEINALAPYGADVISRTSYVHDRGASAQLSAMLKAQILRMIRELSEKTGIAVPEKIRIGGNTIMQHLLCGIDPFPITVFPFTPVTKFAGSDSSILLDGSASANLMPCVSGYFGGDLTAGIYALSNILSPDSRALFTDVGTNCEMALYDGGTWTCCSVASGPALEGGNLSCGMPGLPGAVEHVTLEKGKLRFSVIGGEQPKGICGSGIIDLIAILLEAGIIDETGRMLSPGEAEVQMNGFTEDEDGNGRIALSEDVFLTARDVRMIQMAKAAFAAGVTTLLEARGLSPADIDTVFLAGGFGTFMNIASVTRIGMLPEEFQTRCVPVGNTCLKGTSKAASADTPQSALNRICDDCRYIELSSNSRFNELYIDNMQF